MTPQEYYEIVASGMAQQQAQAQYNQLGGGVYLPPLTGIGSALAPRSTSSPAPATEKHPEANLLLLEDEL